MTRDYFYHLHLHHRQVNDMSTAAKLTNPLLHFWADGEFVYNKRVRRLVFLVLIHYCNITSWFAIALAEIRTRGKFLEKSADFTGNFGGKLRKETISKKQPISLNFVLANFAKIDSIFASI